MIPKQLLESLNLHDSKDKKMAENIWKMLDQMADSNPQDYQNFVDKNLKEGFEALKEEREKKEEPLKITPSVGLLLKMQGCLIETSPPKGNDKFKVDTKIQPWETIRQKFPENVEIFLNICHSDRVILPLDKNKNEINELSLSAINRIVSIPYSLEPAVHSEDQRTHYFVLVINGHVYHFLKERNLPYLINLSCCLLEERLKTDKNPLLSMYRFNQYPDRAVHYEVNKSTIKVDKDISFQVLQQTSPGKMLLEAGSDRRQSKDINNKSQEAVQFKPPEDDQEIKLPEPKFEQSKPKKVLIEEVTEETQGDDLISYNLVKSTTDFKVEFLVPGISSIKEVELDVSTRCIKISLPSLSKRREINLEKPVNVDSVKAKLLKKEGKLSVILPF